MRTGARPALLAVIAATMLAGCGAGGLGGGPAAVVEVVDDVDYYYACGNEVLTLDDGRSFYPFVDQSDVDPADHEVALGDGTLVAASVVLAVVEPGPGDDVGTLTIFDDGIAFWESDSGIEAWLTDEEQTYDFVC